jgi:hypothetical protein
MIGMIISVLSIISWSSVVMGDDHTLLYHRYNEPFQILNNNDDTLMAHDSSVIWKKYDNGMISAMKNNKEPPGNLSSHPSYPIVVSVGPKMNR